MNNDPKSLALVDCDNAERAVDTIVANWQASGASRIVHFIYYSNFILMDSDEPYRSAMELADFVLIDGIGMQLYMKIVKNRWPNNLNGTDLNPILLQRLDRDTVPVAFYGTTEENINAAAVNIRKTLTSDSPYYIQNGFSPLDWSQIQQRSALFIGMGSPRQELWVAEHLETIRRKELLVVTVGGFFDFASGFYIRAPKLVRTLKLEWAWRTMLHPRRHLKKRLRDLTILYRPLWDKWNHRGKNLPIRNI